MKGRLPDFLHVLVSTGYNQVLSCVPHRIPSKWVLYLYFTCFSCKKNLMVCFCLENNDQIPSARFFTLCPVYLSWHFRYSVLLPQWIMKSSLHTRCFSILERIQKYFLFCFEWFLFSFSSWQNSTYFSKAFKTHIMSLPVKHFFLMVPIFRQKELLLLLTS